MLSCRSTVETKRRISFRCSSTLQNADRHGSNQKQFRVVLLRWMIAYVKVLAKTFVVEISKSSFMRKVHHFVFNEQTHVRCETIHKSVNEVKTTE